MAINKPTNRMKNKYFRPATLLSCLGLIGLTLTAHADLQTTNVQTTYANSLMTVGAMQAPANRDTSMLVDNYPDKHVVVKGDTLWDISAKFLRDPWLWPQVWDQNSQIKNPHLIYPGDIITLRWCNGKPCFGIGDGSRRLSPQIRYDDLGQAIPTIPYDAVAGFLSKPTVLDGQFADSLPYVLANADGRLIMFEGNQVYVRGDISMGKNYNIFNIGDPYIDPETGALLGVEALYVGEGDLIRGGDPATMFIRDSRREILRGDRMMPFDAERDLELNFMPKMAASGSQGVIIDVVEGVEYVSQYDIVVINRGSSAGFTRGDILSVYQKGEQVWDPYDRSKPEIPEGEESNWFKRLVAKNKQQGQLVKLPDEPAGIAMVFRVYDNISYALIMSAEREIQEGDMILSPRDIE